MSFHTVPVNNLRPSTVLKEIAQRSQQFVRSKCYKWRDFLLDARIALVRRFVRANLARSDKAVATARGPTTFESLQDLGAACMQVDICVLPTESITKAQEPEHIRGRTDALTNNIVYILLRALEETTTAFRTFSTLILVSPEC